MWIPLFHLATWSGSSNWPTLDGQFAQGQAWLCLQSWAEKWEINDQGPSVRSCFWPGDGDVTHAKEYEGVWPGKTTDLKLRTSCRDAHNLSHPGTGQRAAKKQLLHFHSRISQLLFMPLGSLLFRFLLCYKPHCWGLATSHSDTKPTQGCVNKFAGFFLLLAPFERHQGQSACLKDGKRW